MILNVLNDRNCPASPGTHAARLRRALEHSGSQGMPLCSTGHISERWDPQQRAPVHPGVLLSRGNLRGVLNVSPGTASPASSLAFQGAGCSPETGACVVQLWVQTSH